MSADEVNDAGLVVLGSVKAVFGTRGWLKLHSETRPRDGLLTYRRWLLGKRREWQPFEFEEGRVQGPTLLAKLRGVDDREAAERLIGLNIAVDCQDLPAPPSGTYYWRDLIGLDVVTLEGEALGTVLGLYETGSSDVLRVRGERGETLIPFVRDVFVRHVDLQARRITVDWHADD